MRRKKKTRFIAKILTLIEYFRPDIEEKGIIYLSLKDTKEYFCLEYMDDTYFIRILKDNLRILEMDGDRYKCGFVDDGNGIYIRKKSFSIDRLKSILEKSILEKS